MVKRSLNLNAGYRLLHLVASLNLPAQLRQQSQTNSETNNVPILPFLPEDITRMLKNREQAKVYKIEESIVLSKRDEECDMR